MKKYLMLWVLTLSLLTPYSFSIKGAVIDNAERSI